MVLPPYSIEDGARRRDLTGMQFRLETGYGTALGAQDFNRQMHEQLFEVMVNLVLAASKPMPTILPVDVFEAATSTKVNGLNA